MEIGPLPDFDLWVAVGGRGWVEYAEEVLDARAGDAFLFRPGKTYAGWHDPERPLRVIAVHFDAKTREQRRLLEVLPLHGRVRNTGFMEEVLTRCVHAWERSDQPHADGWLQAAVQEFYRHLDAPVARATSAQIAAIESICDRIRREPGTGYMIDDLAGELGVSADHFTKLFRACIGETPSAHIIRYRIITAQNLLTGSTHSVTRIAEILGYRTVQYFSRQFGEQTGKSPSAYRRDGR